MNIGLCIRVVGLLLMLFSLGTLPSLLMGLNADDGTAAIFGKAFVTTAVSGIILLSLIHI